MFNNKGEEFDKCVYDYIDAKIKRGDFFISSPFMKLFKKKGYFSHERGKNIITDISIEIYVEDPSKNNIVKPSIIIIVECKDYANAVSVDDVEEFHAKLQQIGDDNTKGIIVARENLFQEGAINYAVSKGIMMMAFREEIYRCYNSQTISSRTYT